MKRCAIGWKIPVFPLHAEASRWCLLPLHASQRNPALSASLFMVFTSEHYKAHSYLSVFRELKDWALKAKHPTVLRALRFQTPTSVVVFMECFLKMLFFCHHNNLGFFCLKLEGGRRWASCTISLDRFESEVCRSDLYKSAYASVTSLVRPGEPVRLGMICREYRIPRASRTDALRSLQPGGKGCWALRKGPFQSIPSKGKAALSTLAAKGRKPSGSHMCLERPLHLEFFPKTTTAVLCPSVTCNVSAARFTETELHRLKKK